MTTRGKGQPSMFSMETSNLKPQSLQLPSDMVTDLQDAFDFYDKDNERFISMSHFRNILTNFGFHNLSTKEVNDECRKHDPDFLKRHGFKYDFLQFCVGYRYIK